MSARTEDSRFTDSISELYESRLVPLLFAPYAPEIVARLPHGELGRVLEIAAGTGVVTRSLASALPRSVEIVATDLNRTMLETAAAAGTSRPVEWRQADAVNLPFDDASFDAVVCQFGAMFFPDKPKAFAEMRRVLRPRGTLVFSVWDRIEENELADVIGEALRTLFPADPPEFMRRTPHGYFDRASIEADVAGGGFTESPRFETVAKRSRAPSARLAALAYCQGTPWRTEIETRDPSGLERATEIATAAIIRQFGQGPVDAKIQAHLVSVVK